MIKKLLFLLAIVSSLNIFAQASAYQPPNLSQCNNEVFNLTVQTPIILGNQPQPQFTIQYFVLGGNAISNPQFFVPNGQTAMILATVTNTADGSTASRSFTVTWGFGPTLPSYPNLTVCGGYILPTLVSGANYYTGTNGSGTLLPAGTLIANTQLIYVYAVNASCSSQRSFLITVIQLPNIFVENVSSCASYTLPALPLGQQYFTQTGGTGTPIAAGTTINVTTTIYVYAQSQTAPNCVNESSFVVTIGNPPVNPTASLSACDGNGDGLATFNLASASASVSLGFVSDVSYYLTQADAMAGVNPVGDAYVNVTPFNQIVYTRVSNQNGNCFTIGTLQLNVTTCGAISGVVRLDADNNGCNAADSPVNNIQVVDTIGNSTVYTYTNSAGEYAFADLVPGSHSIYIIPQPGTLANPPSQAVSVSGNGSYTNDFCLTPVAPITDISITYYPLNTARPGLLTSGYVFVRNEGNINANGFVSMNYDATKLTFAGASVLPDDIIGDQIGYNLVNLLPGDVRSFRIDFLVGTPPAVNIGNILIYNVSANINGTDQNINNNSFALTQVVVNSTDPNDKTVAEESMLKGNTAEYLHYMVRFQNVGTANAINVRIEDQLDGNLDWSSFRPVAASHSYQVNRDSNGKLTFVFNNINLVPKAESETASQGFVAYEVKQNPSITAGDQVYNTAAIYFDFNAPIVTNTVMTNLITMLDVKDYRKQTFLLHPNPASGMVSIDAQGFDDFSYQLFDLQGKKILENKASGSASFDVTSLQKGVYYVKVTTGKATQTKKLLVK